MQQCELGGKTGVNWMEIRLNWKKGTSCAESAIKGKEKRVKQKGKSNESKSLLSFF